MWMAQVFYSLVPTCPSQGERSSPMEDTLDLSYGIQEKQFYKERTRRRISKPHDLHMWVANQMPGGVSQVTSMRKVVTANYRGFAGL